MPILNLVKTYPFYFLEKIKVYACHSCKKEPVPGFVFDGNILYDFILKLQNVRVMNDVLPSFLMLCVSIHFVHLL